MIEPTTEMVANAAVRQRRWLRWFCWSGSLIVVLSLFLVLSHPLVVRWQLRRHGWSLEPSNSRRSLPDWLPVAVDPWFWKIGRAGVSRRPLFLKDVESLGRFPDLTYLSLIETEITDQTLARVAELCELRQIDFNNSTIEESGLSHLATRP